MSVTRGGKNKRKRFRWNYDESNSRVEIVNEDGLQHLYSIVEIQAVLMRLHTHFGDTYFPLANNVEKLGNGTEKLGLGSVILEQKPEDISHAQGSSYLGVVFEECHYFEWNGSSRGIEWHILDYDFEIETIIRKSIVASKINQL